MPQQNKKIGKASVTTFAVSLLLAAVIWLVHNLSQTYTDIVTVSVSAVSNIEGRSRNSANDIPVIARCKGTGFALIAGQVFGRGVSYPVEFDADDFKYLEGDTYRISEPALDKYFKSIFNSFLTLESFVTTELDFRFQQENCKRVPIMPVTITSYASQYTSLGGVRLLQDSVTVYGEPSKLESLESVLTFPIVQKDIKKSVRGTVKLEAPFGLRISEDEVFYQLDVVRFVELADRVQIIARNVPAGLSFKLYPGTADVTVRCIFPCDADPFNGMEFYVDYDEFVESLTGKCIIRHNELPDGVIDCKIDPQFCECMIGDN